MPLANVLVHVGNGAQSSGRLDAAAIFAHNLQAHLTGLYVIPELEIPGVAYAYVGNEIIEHQRELAVQDAAEAKAAEDAKGGE